MLETRRGTCLFTLLAALAACGGSKPSKTPPILPNAAPVMQLPSSLTGTGGSFRYTLPVTDPATLTFTATDADGDSLHWQIVGATAAVTTVGLVPPTQLASPSFVLEVIPVTIPATASFVLIVEDSRGSATAIDLMVVRSGPPGITGIRPNSAFGSRPQQVTITGTALSLGGTATTTTRFGGLIATNATTPNETTLLCTTPNGMGSGPRIVSVTNSHGSSALLASAFTSYTFPPTFGGTDQALDSGGGSALAMAQDGSVIQAVWLEGGLVMHRTSADGGTAWSAMQTLSGGELPTEPQVAIVGQQVTVIWVGDGSSLQARRSDDGGVTFQPALVLNPLAGTMPARRPRLCASADHRYAAWLAGDATVGAARLTVATSTNAGAWTAPAAVANGGANQAAHTMLCDGANAWLLFTDERQGPGIPGAYTCYSTDGGTSWSAAGLRSPANSPISAPCLCTSAGRVHAAWLRLGALQYVVSETAGASWSPPAELQGTANGAITEPALACENNRVFATYIAGGNSVWVSRITASGAAAQHVMISTTAVLAGSPRIAHRGSYVFVAWRRDDVTNGSARIVQSVSTDAGLTFTAPIGFGNGTAAQDEPHLLVDGARQLIGWTDARGATPALFVNRNNP